MHVLGLPPAFVLSQDQTLKLKVWILDFGLEVNPRNHLRNGHLHNMTSTSVSRSKHHGDGIETQSSSRVCCDFSLATEIRQDPAVCVSLPSNSIVKEQIREHKFVRRRTARFFRDDRSSTGHPGLKPQSFENLMPCEGGEAMLPASEAPLNNIAVRVSTPVYKNSLPFYRGWRSRLKI